MQNDDVTDKFSFTFTENKNLAVDQHSFMNLGQTVANVAEDKGKANFLVVASGATDERVTVQPLLDARQLPLSASSSITVIDNVASVAGQISVATEGLPPKITVIDNVASVAGHVRAVKEQTGREIREDVFMNMCQGG